MNCPKPPREKSADSNFALDEVWTVAMKIKEGKFAIAAAALLLAVTLGACSSGPTDVPSEGTVNDPVRIGDSPSTYSGTVAIGGNSYFVVFGDAGNWTVAISNIDGKPDLYVYGDPGYSSLLCQSVNPDDEPESCTIACPTACDIYIRISGTADSGASFNLLLFEETATSAAGEYSRLVAQRDSR